jgi:hypothetical protein
MVTAENPVSFVSEFSSFYVGGSSYLANNGGVVSSTECVVPQRFVTGGNRPYLDYWTVTGDLQYPGYKSCTAFFFPLLILCT